MGIGEQHPAGGKAVDVGGEGLRVTFQATDPVIQVIDRNEQHVGGWTAGNRGCCINDSDKTESRGDEYDEARSRVIHWICRGGGRAQSEWCCSQQNE